MNTIKQMFNKKPPIYKPNQVELKLLEEAKKFNPHQKEGFLRNILKSEFETLSLEFIQQNFNISTQIIQEVFIEHITQDKTQNPLNNINPNKPIYPINPFARTHAVALCNTLSPKDLTNLKDDLIKRRDLLSKRFIDFDEPSQQYIIKKFPKLFKRIAPALLLRCTTKNNKELFNQQLNLIHQTTQQPINDILENFLISIHAHRLTSSDFIIFVTEETLSKNLFHVTQDVIQNIHTIQNPLRNFDENISYDYNDHNSLPLDPYVMILLQGLSPTMHQMLQESIKQSMIHFSSLALEQQLPQKGNTSKSIKKI